MTSEVEIKESQEVDFILRSLGAYLKVPVEVKAKFGLDVDTASPKVTAEQDKGSLTVTYTFALDRDGKVKKQQKRE